MRRPSQCCFEVDTYALEIGDSEDQTRRGWNCQLLLIGGPEYSDMAAMLVCAAVPLDATPRPMDADGCWLSDGGTLLR
jgi:hypothetical protein